MKIPGYAVILSALAYFIFSQVLLTTHSTRSSSRWALVHRTFHGVSHIYFKLWSPIFALVERLRTSLFMLLTDVYNFFQSNKGGGGGWGGSHEQLAWGQVPQHLRGCYTGELKLCQ
jgi:hypothetical protein